MRIAADTSNRAHACLRAFLWPPGRLRRNSDRITRTTCLPGLRSGLVVCWIPERTHRLWVQSKRLLVSRRKRVKQSCGSRRQRGGTTTARAGGRGDAWNRFAPTTAAPASPRFPLSSPLSPSPGLLPRRSLYKRHHPAASNTSSSSYPLSLSPTTILSFLFLP